MRLLLSITIALGAIAASDPNGDPFTFLLPDVKITAEERGALGRGLPVISVLDTEGHELAVFTAIQVGSSVTADRMTAWLRNVAEFRRSSYVLEVRRFSNPARLEDLHTLTLDEGDLKDIDACRPGHCGMKLSAGEIERLQRLIQASGKHWKPAVKAAFRQLVLQRVASYMEKGHAALDAYYDARKPRLPAVAFAHILQRTTFLREHSPAIAQTLERESPLAAADAEQFIYWSKERFGGKSVVTATHVRIFRPTEMKDVEVVMVGTQIFATHYLDACLGVTALVRDRRSSQAYFVYFNRSDVDLLRGFWGRLTKRVIEGRLDDDGPAILREVARRLSSGDPPVQSMTLGASAPK